MDKTQKLTTSIYTSHRASDERWVADRTNSVLGIHSELIRLVLVQSRYSEAHLNDVCEIGLHPSATGSFPPLHTVASDLAATIVRRPLPGQTDRVLGDFCDTNVCWGL